MDNTVGINDIVLTKDGQQLRILSVQKTGNDIQRLWGIDDNAPTPMRTPILKDNFQRIMRKSPWKYDAKTGEKVDAVTGKPWIIQEVSK
jgi:hypothetical protein